jgi:hypothetical protein
MGAASPDCCANAIYGVASKAPASVARSTDPGTGRRRLALTTDGAASTAHMLMFAL